MKCEVYLPVRHLNSERNVRKITHWCADNSVKTSQYWCLLVYERDLTLFMGYLINYLTRLIMKGCKANIDLGNLRSQSENSENMPLRTLSDVLSILQFRSLDTLNIDYQVVIRDIHWCYTLWKDYCKTSGIVKWRKGM